MHVDIAGELPTHARALRQSPCAPACREQTHLSAQTTRSRVFARRAGLAAVTSCATGGSAICHSFLTPFMSSEFWVALSWHLVVESFLWNRGWGSVGTSNVQ